MVAAVRRGDSQQQTPYQLGGFPLGIICTLALMAFTSIIHIIVYYPTIMGYYNPVDQ